MCCWDSIFEFGRYFQVVLKLLVVVEKLFREKFGNPDIFDGGSASLEMLKVFFFFLPIKAGAQGKVDVNVNVCVGAWDLRPTQLLCEQDDNEQWKYRHIYAVVPSGKSATACLHSRVGCIVTVHR